MKKYIIILCAIVVFVVIAVMFFRYDKSTRSDTCDPLATTTDCLSVLPQDAFEVNAPTVVQPIEEWTSASNTPISLAGFSFELPSGWNVLVYPKGASSGFHAVVHKDQNKPSFVIDCPPDGKGLEAATRFSTEERSFTKDKTTYTVSFERWTAPGNDPWFFVWLRKQLSDGSPVCLAQGSIDPETEDAMRALYSSLR